MRPYFWRQGSARRTCRRCYRYIAKEVELLKQLCYNFFDTLRAQAIVKYRVRGGNNLKFEIIQNIQPDKRQVIYLDQEHSFYTEPFLYSDFTVMLGCDYIGLDVDLSSSKIMNISGFSSQKNWINKILSAPATTKNGTIKIISDSELCAGTGTYLFERADMYCNIINGWCYIDGMTELRADQNIRFCENIIFSLCGNSLVGIWIRLKIGIDAN